MKVVAYRVRRVLRSSWRSTVAITAVVAIVVAIVLAIAAGASRTSTAPDRYSQASNLRSDLTVQQERGPSRTAEVGRLPSVATAISVTFVFGGLEPLGHRQARPDTDLATLAGEVNATGGRLVSGRAPQPDRPGEFAITKTYATQQHIHLGDRFRLVTLSQQQADKNGFGVTHPDGPSLTATVVGIVDGPDQLDDPSPAAFFSRSLLDKHPGTVATIMSVVLKPGATDAQFKAQLQARPNSDIFIVAKSEVISDSLRTAVQGQSRGLWMVALVSAVAAVVAVSQLVTRQVRAPDHEQAALAAMGVTRGQIVAEMAAHAAVPVILGCLLGGVLAALPSGVFPVGFVGRIEPSPGFRIEWVVLVLGMVVLATAVLASVVGALALATRRHRARPTSPLLARAVRLPNGPMATGIGFAFSPRSGDGPSIRGAVLGIVAGLACLVGALTFGVSLDRLVDEPVRWGSNYDAELGQGATSIPKNVLDEVKRNPVISGVTLFGTTQTRIGGTSIQLEGMQTVRGDLTPPVLEGRLPVADDELGLGRLAARSLHAKVGTVLRLTSRGRAIPFRVTGIVVVPSVEGVDGVGQSGLVTLAGMARVAPHKAATTLVIKVPATTSSATRSRLYRELSGGGDTGAQSPPSGPGQPPAIVNIDRIRTIPYLLAGVLALLLALTIGHVVLTSIRRRGRDVAIVRALGGDRRWVLQTLSWQGLAVALVPVVIGVPLGLWAGARVFNLFADSIGTVDAATASVLATVVVAVAALVLSLVVVLATRRVRTAPPAAVLRSE